MSKLAERIIMGQGPVGVLQEHLTRYVFALRCCAGRTVCDVGCGTGYGTWLISHVASNVVGFDIDPLAVLHARREWGQTRKRAYHIAALGDWGGSSYQTVVAFEVLEHTKDPTASLKQCQDILADDGVLVGSLPIHQGNNPYHVAGDMGWVECVDTVVSVFKHPYFFYQPLSVGRLDATNARILSCDRWCAPTNGYCVFVASDVDDIGLDGVV